MALGSVPHGSGAPLGRPQALAPPAARPSRPLPSLALPPGCTAGYYWTADSQCLPCGYGGYCAGAKSTALSAQRIPCGDNKNTTSEYAKTDRECREWPAR
jgi:hypothetical protein